MNLLKLQLTVDELLRRLNDIGSSVNTLQCACTDISSELQDLRHLYRYTSSDTGFSLATQLRLNATICDKTLMKLLEEIRQLHTVSRQMHQNLSSLAGEDSAISPTEKQLELGRESLAQLKRWNQTSIRTSCLSVSIEDISVRSHSSVPLDLKK